MTTFSITILKVSTAFDGVQAMRPQNIALGHNEYLKLKEFEKKAKAER